MTLGLATRLQLKCNPYIPQRRRERQRGSVPSLRQLTSGTCEGQGSSQAAHARGTLPQEPQWAKITSICRGAPTTLWAPPHRGAALRGTKFAEAGSLTHYAPPPTQGQRYMRIDTVRPHTTHHALGEFLRRLRHGHDELIAHRRDSRDGDSHPDLGRKALAQRGEALLLHHPLESLPPTRLVRHFGLHPHLDGIEGVGDDRRGSTSQHACSKVHGRPLQHGGRAWHHELLGLLVASPPDGREGHERPKVHSGSAVKSEHAVLPIYLLDDIPAPPVQPPRRRSPTLCEPVPLLPAGRQPPLDLYPLHNDVEGHPEDRRDALSHGPCDHRGDA
mmetsp:Transcript_40217/g.98806  ORF Transcript_40217/g.98806 Transcript_40217/m.98806 type:complete len:331 (+) Transcript_40217:217-1209(+)